MTNEQMKGLEWGRKCVEHMYDDGWCEHCNSSFHNCYEQGFCDGGRPTQKTKRDEVTRDG